ncbi:MAG TPA: hypothetical protein VIY86_01670, partial [Pirellulaceae bacterium]
MTVPPDEELAAWLGELADRVARGIPVGLESAAMERPHLATELRELWGTVMLADAVGNEVNRRSSSESSPGTVASS